MMVVAKVVVMVVHGGGGPERYSHRLGGFGYVFVV
jgi:hypothetical protein